MPMVAKTLKRPTKASPKASPSARLNKKTRVSSGGETEKQSKVLVADEPRPVKRRKSEAAASAQHEQTGSEGVAVVKAMSNGTFSTAQNLITDDLVLTKDAWPGGETAFAQLTSSQKTLVNQGLKGLVLAGELPPKQGAVYSWPKGSEPLTIAINFLKGRAEKFAADKAGVSVAASTSEGFQVNDLVSTKDAWPGGAQALARLTDQQRKSVQMGLRGLVAAGKLPPKRDLTGTPLVGQWAWPKGSDSLRIAQSFFESRAEEWKKQAEEGQKARCEERPKSKKSKAKQAEELAQMEEEEEEQSGEESEEDSVAPTEQLGPMATVWLPPGGVVPPKGLLPRDAKVEDFSQAALRQLPAEVYPDTLHEAQKEGIVARELWGGLGEIPKGLPKNFRLVAICGASGTGKTTALRNLLRLRFPESLQQGSLVLVHRANSEQKDSSLPSITFPVYGQVVGVEEHADASSGRRFRVRLEEMPDVELHGVCEHDVEMAVIPNFGRATWGVMRPMLQAFENAKEGMHCLSAVGFSAVPSWLKPYEILSKGQKYRANLAMLMARHMRLQSASTSKDLKVPLCLDEFTSELDRPAAQAVALSLRKRIARQGSHGWVVSTCNADIIPHLQPEYLIVCEAGQAPRLIRGWKDFSSVDILTELQTAPLPPSGLDGHWQGNVDQAFQIRNLELTVQNVGYTVLKEDGDAKGCFVAECFRSKKKKLSDEGGNISDMQMKMHLRLEGNGRTECLRGTYQMLEDGDWDAKDAIWGSEETLNAQRLALHLYRVDADMVREDAEYKSAGISYQTTPLEVLRKRRWYLPQSLDDGRFQGLHIQQCHDFAEPFILTTKQKYPQPKGRDWLAVYVGTPEGGLDETLFDAEVLLDDPPDGLCVHKLPQAKLDEQPGNLGIILGPSGSGKSSLAQFRFGPPVVPSWDPSSPVLGHFPSLRLARQTLSAAGLSEELAMAPYCQLSSGEQSRADLARILAHRLQNPQEKQVLVVGEFTSLLDRSTAQTVAANVTRFLRDGTDCGLEGPPLVLISCHEDVVGLGKLEPDWVYETQFAKLSCLSAAPLDAGLANEKAPLVTGTPSPKLKKVSGTAKTGSASPRKRHSPGNPSPKSHASLRSVWDSVALGLRQVKILVHRAMPCEWAHFFEHHYKNHSLNTQAFGWIGTLAGRPVACTYAIILAPNYVGNARKGQATVFGSTVQTDPCYMALPQSWAYRPAAREHRTVVMPDFQGWGLGSAMSDAVGRELELQGHIFVSKTMHPHFGSYRDRSPFWRPCHNNHEINKNDGQPSFHHFWVGAVNPDGTYDPAREKKLAARVADERGAVWVARQISVGKAKKNIS